METPIPGAGSKFGKSRLDNRNRRNFRTGDYKRQGPWAILRRFARVRLLKGGEPSPDEGINIWFGRLPKMPGLAGPHDENHKHTEPRKLPITLWKL